MPDSRPPLAVISVSADVVVFTVEKDELKVLLIRRPEDPFAGSWALPGGFLWEGEDSEQAARRVLKDKAGVEGPYIEQLYTFDRPQRDPRGRVLSVTYFALAARESLRIGKEAEEVTLFSVHQLPPLAFDHAAIIAYAVKRLQAKLSYTNAAYSLLPKHFTLTQLQKLHEIIFGTELDKRNFRKKYLSLDLIEPTEEMLEGGKHRPARLYRFTNREPLELIDRAFTMK